MARSVSSWLSGPEPADSVDNAYPGQALGLPQVGPRSLARTGRRLAALCVDWLISYGIAALLMSLGWIPLAMLSTAVLAVWFVVGAVSVRLYGFSPGQLAGDVVEQEPVIPALDHRGGNAPQFGEAPVRPDDAAVVVDGEDPFATVVPGWAGFDPDDDFCPTWRLFDMLPEGADGWRAQFKYG